jgi:membrane protease YdiL (CAAX protease family)
MTRGTVGSPRRSRTGGSSPIRGAAHRRRTRRRLLALAVAIVLLVASNIMANRILPASAPWAYVHWHRPVGVGLLLAGATAGIFALGMALPATRNAFLDSRAAEWGIGGMLYQVLVRIPLGTVVLEEVAFRGVLPALMGGSPAIRWRWLPVLGASACFGLWHILPSIGINQGNAAVASVLGGNQFVTSLLAVLSMVVAGVLMCALARLGKGVKTTMLLHWATNSLGFVAAWLVMH